MLRDILLDTEVGLGLTTGLALHGVFKSVYPTPPTNRFDATEILELSIAKILGAMAFLTRSKFMMGISLGMTGCLLGSSLQNIYRLSQQQAYQPAPSLSGPRGPSI